MFSRVELKLELKLKLKLKLKLESRWSGVSLKIHYQIRLTSAKMLVVAGQREEAAGPASFEPTMTIPVRGSAPKIFKRIGRKNHYGNDCIMYACPDCKGVVALKVSEAGQQRR
jgi:hypothetical protein